MLASGLCFLKICLMDLDMRDKYCLHSVENYLALRPDSIHGTQTFFFLSFITAAMFY